MLNDAVSVGLSYTEHSSFSSLYLRPDETISLSTIEWSPLGYSINQMLPVYGSDFIRLRISPRLKNSEKPYRFKIRDDLLL